MKLLDLRLFVLAFLLITSCVKEEVEPADPIVPVILENGPVITGQVLDTDGVPVAKAVVTDGFIHGETDAQPLSTIFSLCAPTTMN